MTKFTCTLLVLCLALADGAPAQEVSELAVECEACHGPGGVSAEEDVPSLAGKSVNYLREMLDQFDNYERHCKTTTYRHGDRAKTPMSMCNVADGLSEADKQALAEYFSSQ